MLVGKSPFHAASDHLAFRKVLGYADGNNELQFPAYIGEDVKTLISLLLSKDPVSRLGMSDDVLGSIRCFNSIKRSNSPMLEPKCYQSIRNYSFFQYNEKTTIWSMLESKGLKPPYKPSQPKWMTELHQGKISLKPLARISFDL